MSPAAEDPGRTPADSALLLEVESWFRARGVPQLVEDYATERRVDADAWPWLGPWLVTGTVLWWGMTPTRAGRSSGSRPSTPSSGWAWVPWRGGACGAC